MDKNRGVQIAKWHAWLLRVVIYGFVFGSISGFVLFFYGSFLGSTSRLILVHWVLGLVFLLPYIIYQLRHYLSVRVFSGQLHYRVGLFTFFSVCVMSLSGIPLIFDLDTGRLRTIIDMTHIVSSFAFLCFISAHLVLVARITARRARAEGGDVSGLFPRLSRLVLWVPLAVSCVLVVLPLL